jgi:hypothetical protein
LFNSPHQFLALLLGSVLILPFAAVTPDTSENRAQKQGEVELLDLHKEERRAHFEHDVKFLLAHIGTELLDIRDGQVNRMSREDVRAKFVEYFKNADFSAWDDLEPPRVRVSADGKTGWIIVRVRIAYTASDQSGKTTNQSTVGAWMSAYEKQNGTWVMTAVTSTFAEK